ncbi:type II secretion system protein [Candidatus Saccharibacteria bacterium]|nr:type II secretion system protein [Candidatus Saccharibacteria bacterium]
MRHTANKSSGFTLVEVLVIAPIVILFIGSFVGLLVGLTGESLVVRERNAAIYNTQAALDDIELNVNKTTGFLTNTTGIAISSPQGKNNSATAWTNTNGVGQPETLIIKSVATTKNSNDPSRSIIYTGTGTCDSKKPLFEYLTIYFVALDPDTLNDTTDKALYKRTIIPQYSACDTPAQKGSCYDSLVASNPTICKVSDDKLVSNVANFDISYFVDNTTAADTAANTATDAAVTLSLSKQVAGNAVAYSGIARSKSQNVQSANGGGVGIGGGTTPPANPVVTWTRSPTSPYKTNVTWGYIGNATSYDVKYGINGGSIQTKNITQPGSGSTVTTDIDASHRKQTVQLTDITVNTTSGSFSYGSMPTISAIPAWNECSFQNGWRNYGTATGTTTYATGGYTKTSSKIVGLKGLVSTGTINQTICTLPVGFRPKFATEKLIFQAPSSNGTAGARIDILSTGEIIATSGSNGWVSLDGIMFIADDSSYSWTTGTWQNGWTDYGFGHSYLRHTTDNQGRKHVQGLANGGVNTNGTVMTAIGTAPSNILHVNALHGGGPGIVQVNTAGQIVVRSTPSGWQQIQLFYRPSTATGWLAMPFSSGWQNYGGVYPEMRCHRGTDDIVVVQGLINHPTSGSGTYIGDTGPCGRFSSGKGIGIEDRLLLSQWMSNETAGRIDMVNGVSLLSVTTQPAWNSLDTIHFIAD